MAVALLSLRAPSSLLCGRGEKRVGRLISCDLAAGAGIGSRDSG